MSRTPSGLEPSRRTFVVMLAAILLLGGLFRLLFPTADPPWRTTVGIVWHDEGAWVHNARNKALFGEWRLDEWNPMYVAPVFSAFEYGAFKAFGVGLWQARLVSEIGGCLTVLWLGLALARAGGRSTGLWGAALLSTNYVFVMWNRVALLETTMVMFLVAGLYCYARALESPRWGVAAGLCAWLAFFSKAAAAFFLPALALAAVWPWVVQWSALRVTTEEADREREAGIYTLVGLVAGALIGFIVYVLPNWNEFFFYNWQMSVTRKPAYTARALLDRLSWFPVLHDTFTRMFLVVVVATTACVAAFARWRTLPGVDRLLFAWVGVGSAELVIHDVGNERRFVMLIPALCALAALAICRDRRVLPEATAAVPRRVGAMFAPVLLYAAYVVAAPLGRLPFLYRVRPAVWLSASVAAIAVLALLTYWPRIVRALAGARLSADGVWLLLAVVMAGDIAQFAQWAAGRTYLNYEAARAVADRLPPGTLVHGKLANGLSLESRIKPVFVGRNFGNYADRLQRPDVAYVLTYISPEVGYEGPVINDVLEALPTNRVLWTAPVAETTCGCDAVALIAKEVTPATQQQPALSTAGLPRE
ncbi:MAG: ArnT family glycosyltransferase [Vicinamibacterales bacterium]